MSSLAGLPPSSASSSTWRCDVCKTRTFPTFDLACAHESLCDGRGGERCDAPTTGKGGGSEVKVDSPVISPPRVEGREKGKKGGGSKTLEGFFGVSKPKKERKPEPSDSNKKPRGRPPKGMRWDVVSGGWVVDSESKAKSSPKKASGKAAERKKGGSTDPGKKERRADPRPIAGGGKEGGVGGKVNTFFMTSSQRLALELEEKEGRRRERERKREEDKRKSERLIRKGDGGEFFRKKEGRRAGSGKAGRVSLEAMPGVGAGAEEAVRFPREQNVNVDEGGGGVGKRLSPPPTLGEEGGYDFGPSGAGAAATTIAAATATYFTKNPGGALPPLDALPSTRAEIRGSSNRKQYDAVVDFMSSFNASSRALVATDDEGMAWDSDDSRAAAGCGRVTAMVVCGPSGSFKTGLVHMAARDVGLDVLEVNTGAGRNQGSLKKTFEEATASRGIRGGGSVLLVDECDNVWQGDGDKNFWIGVKGVMRGGKVPVVMTCNALPTEVKGMRVKPVEVYTSLKGEGVRRERMEKMVGISKGGRELDEEKAEVWDAHIKVKRRPVVRYIEPRAVPKEGGAVVTVVGAGLSPLEGGAVWIEVDGRRVECTLTGDARLTFVSPPPILPPGVGDGGLYVGSWEESQVVRFCDVEVVHGYSGAVVVRADAGKMEWKWPVVKDAWSKREKARRDRRRGSSGTSFMEDFFDDEIDDDDIVDSDLENRDGGQKVVLEQDDDLRGKKRKGALDSPRRKVGMPPESPVRKRPFFPPSLPQAESEELLDPKKAREQLDVMRAMAKEAEYRSVAGWLDDEGMNCLPYLAGRTEGFACEMENSPDGMFTGKNLTGKLKNAARAPSSEMIFKKGWTDGYYGSADCFVQRPTHEDRLLLGGGGTYRTDRYNREDEEDNVQEDTGADGTEFLPGNSYATTMAEAVRSVARLPPRRPPRFYADSQERASELVGLAFQVMGNENANVYTFCYGNSKTYRLYAFHEDWRYEEEGMLNNSAFSRGGGGDMRCFYTRMDDRMALDYIPWLRAISVAEATKDKSEEENGGRRRKRMHKLDSFGIKLPNEYCGREVGERLTKLQVGGVTEFSEKVV